MTIHASEAETPDDRKERLYQELCKAIRELGEGPLMTREYCAVANDAYWQRHIDNDDLLSALKTHLTAARQGLGFVKDIYTILDRECVNEISLIMSEATLAAAESIQTALRCTPSELMEAESTLGIRTRALIHYALTSPDYAAVTGIIKERKPASVESLMEIMAEGACITAPLKNGAL
jgi:hypothetical protein